MLRLSDYIWRRELGEEAYGSVVAAEERATGRLVSVGGKRQLLPRVYVSEACAVCGVAALCAPAPATPVVRVKLRGMYTRACPCWGSHL